MDNSPFATTHIRTVSSFEELVSTPFEGAVNALCWMREIVGDFSEIIQKVNIKENIYNLEIEELLALDLS